jgi:hypothetical protein
MDEIPSKPRMYFTLRFLAVEVIDFISDALLMVTRDVHQGRLLTLPMRYPRRMFELSSQN